MSENLTVNPIKLSQPAGAALAFMGVKGAIPLWHGVQGCTAFAKVLFIQHFREPMPFQTTALTQTTVVMGGDNNAAEAVEHIKDKAQFIGLLTTGVTETSGADLNGIVRNIREKDKDVRIVSVSTPDYEGNLETGYAKAAKAMLKSICKTKSGLRHRQVAIFPGPYVTPGEVEELKRIAEEFTIRPVVFPDLGGSLYGRLTDKRFSSTSIGGTPVDEIESLADSAFVVSIGRSMESVAAEFSTEYALDHFNFDHLSSIGEVDSFLKLLSERSGQRVPERLRRDRSHLQDTALDTHFYFAGKRAKIAGDPDFVIRWKGAIEEAGLQADATSTASFDDIKAGDLMDLFDFSKDEYDLVIVNSHGAIMAEEKGIAAIRAGMPVFDRLGEPQKVRLGYAGIASLYMECANELIKTSKHFEPYISRLQSTLR